MNRYVEPVTIPALIVAAGLAILMLSTGCDEARAANTARCTLRLVNGDVVCTCEARR